MRSFARTESVCRSLVLGVSAVSMAWAMPALAQSGGDQDDADETPGNNVIIVTA